MNKEIEEKLAEIERNLLLTVTEHMQNVRSELLRNLEDKDIPGVWQPKYTEHYWYISSGGKSFLTNNFNTNDKHNIECYNFYRDKKVTEREAKFLRAYRKFRHLARELNNGWKPDWSDDSTYKFSIYFDGKSKYPYKVDNTTECKEVGSVHFKTLELAETAWAAMTEEEKAILKEEL